MAALATGRGTDPNTQVGPTCLGLPGSLPVANRAAIESIIRLNLLAPLHVGLLMLALPTAAARMRPATGLAPPPPADVEVVVGLDEQRGGHDGDRVAKDATPDDVAGGDQDRTVTPVMADQQRIIDNLNAAAAYVRARESSDGKLATIGRRAGVVDELGADIDLDGTPIRIDASIGVALFLYTALSMAQSNKPAGGDSILPFKAVEKTLDNGLKVLVKVDRRAPAHWTVACFPD